jgi:hypothetical protein
VKNGNQTQKALAVYCGEHAFYRAHLKIDPQTGRNYLRLGLFSPDALTGTGKRNPPQNRKHRNFAPTPR